MREKHLGGKMIHENAEEKEKETQKQRGVWKIWESKYNEKYKVLQEEGRANGLREIGERGSQNIIVRGICGRGESVLDERRRKELCVILLYYICFEGVGIMNH